MNVLELQEKLKNLNIDISAKEICSIWGMDEAAFSRKKKFGSEIKFKNIKQLEEAYNIDLTGTYKIKQYNEDSILVDYYTDIEVSCGNGIFPLSESVEKISIPLKAISDYSINASYSIIKAKSDSMQPEIKPKDLLIVQKYQGEPIKDNHIYIFIYDGCLYCKYLSNNLGQIIVRSANTLYPVRYIENEDLNNFTIIGEVKGHLRDYFAK